jgi:hypothetical protein
MLVTRYKQEKTKKIHSMTTSIRVVVVVILKLSSFISEVGVDT